MISCWCCLNFGRWGRLVGLIWLHWAAPFCLFIKSVRQSILLFSIGDTCIFPKLGTCLFEQFHPWSVLGNLCSILWTDDLKPLRFRTEFVLDVHVCFHSIYEQASSRTLWLKAYQLSRHSPECSPFSLIYFQYLWGSGCRLFIIFRSDALEAYIAM
jgi:hypothetical protein